MKLILFTFVFFLTSIITAIPFKAQADDGISPHGTSVNTEDFIKFIENHLEAMAMSSDYRFQRDIAVIFAGCGTIPEIPFKELSPWEIKGGLLNYKANCYKTHLQMVSTNEVEFGTLVDSICTTVQNTFLADSKKRYPRLQKFMQVFGSDWDGTINWNNTAIVVNYSSCIKNINSILGNKSPLTSTVNICEESGAYQDYNTKPDCYHEVVPQIEKLNPALPKPETTTVTVTPIDVDGTPNKANKGFAARVNSLKGFPERSPWDIQKAKSVYYGCTAMNSADLTETNRQHISVNELTYSDYRELNCFRDGFIAIAMGANVARVIQNACRDRIPGVHGQADYNLQEWRDYRTMCLRNSTKMSGDISLMALERRIKLDNFSETRAFFGGLFDNSKWDKYISEIEEQIDRETKATLAGNQAKLQEKTDSASKTLDNSQAAAVSGYNQARSEK